MAAQRPSRIPRSQHVDPSGPIEDAAKQQQRGPSYLPATTVRGGMLRECEDRLDQEDDAGAVEYKWRLVGISDTRLQHLVTQMQFRVGEGGGECIYEIGVEDDGVPRGLDPSDYATSIATLRRMAARLGFTVSILFERVVQTEPVLMRCAEVRVRNVASRLESVRVAMIGSSDVGKSTLTSVLCTGELDNGAGSARQSVFNHRHELESGRTSSVSRRLLGFDSCGEVINYETQTDHMGANRQEPRKRYVFEQAELCDENLAQRAASMVSLLDLPGDTRHQVTSWGALLGRRPHCGCIVTSAVKTTVPEEQMHAFAAMGLPFFIVLSNHDRVTSPSALADLVARINGAVQRLDSTKRAKIASLRATPVSSPGKPPKRADSFDFFIDDEGATDAPSPGGGGAGMFCESQPGSRPSSDDFFINTPTTQPPAPQFPSQASAPADAASLHQLVPIFVVSSVTGHGIDALRRFLHRLSIDPAHRATPSTDPNETRVLVHDWLIKDGVTIALGTVARGEVTAGSKMVIGPIGTAGVFAPVTVETIQVERLFASCARQGADASFALDGHGADLELWLDGSARRRGIVMSSPEAVDNFAVSTCWVDVIGLGDSAHASRWSTCKDGHTVLFLCGNGRVSARVSGICKDGARLTWSNTSLLSLVNGSPGAVLLPNGTITAVNVTVTAEDAPGRNRDASDVNALVSKGSEPTTSDATDESSSTASPDSHHAPSATESGQSGGIRGACSVVQLSGAAGDFHDGKSALQDRTVRNGKRKHDRTKRRAAERAAAVTADD